VRLLKKELFEEMLIRYSRFIDKRTVGAVMGVENITLEQKVDALYLS
jgi:hypothetical protein